ncbi:hypothetical protein BDZ89DRAFT_1154745 [Hymenopellis radicata]|nr:hypothetical protein BDZ89DRAFT_1154745 [Hymenopellis radicata]
MDVDWCLTCERQLNGPWTYCSSQCRDRAVHLRLASTQPSSSSLLYPHHIRLVSSSDDLSGDGDDDEPIYHPILAVDPPQPIPDSESSTWTFESIEAWRVGVSPSRMTPNQLRSYNTPKLLKQQRTVPPTLCMSKPLPLAEPSRQNYPLLSSQPTSILSSLSSRFRRLRCPPAPVMISPFTSTDSLATPVPSSVGSSPVNEKLPEDLWWSIKREPEPIESCSVSRSISIKRPPLIERPIPQGDLHLAPPPPAPVVRVRDDHPFKARGRARKPHSQ